MSRPAPRDPHRWTVYTDGGAEPNPGPGGWGVVLLPPGETPRPRELSGGSGHTTNNRMELTAAIEALEAIPEGGAVDLYTDSRYLQQGVTKWLAGWIRRGWKRQTGEIQNLDLWQRLAALRSRHDVRWRWVKGHAGHRHNERADALATEAMKEHGGGKAAAAARAADLPAEVDAELFLRVTCQGGKGGWAALVREGEEEETLTGRLTRTTSNQLDLTAACEALEALPEDVTVAVHTASDYLRHGASQWLAGWKRNGWKTKSGGEVKNAPLWQRLDRAQSRRRVGWARLPDKGPEAKRLSEVLRGL